jgi:Zn-dependent M28 family amino/carboxypeptidase
MKSYFPALLKVLLLLSPLLVTVALLIQPFVAPLPSTPPAVDPARLEAHVRRLAVDFHARSFEHPDKLAAAAAYIAAQFRAAGARVELQEVRVEGETFHNVIARFGPQQGQAMVVGAHYDSHGDTPGADDNASGVSGLIELAHLLGAAPPARPVELVAYTLEEPPHFRSDAMGSVWHAQSLRAAGTDVRLMLALEMIGFFSDKPGSQSFPAPGMSLAYSDRGNFIALVNRFEGFAATRRAKALMAGASDLPVYSLNGPVFIQGVDYSDHRSYWAAGYPAMMVTDTAFQRNRQYHRPGDLPARLDYRRMAKVVQGVYAVVVQY